MLEWKQIYKEIHMKQQGESTISCQGSIVWLIAVIYAFAKWGFWHGILNIFVPYSLAIDIVRFLIKLLS